MLRYFRIVTRIITIFICLLRTPPSSPPPFQKAESRFEREQKIRVGSVDRYQCGSGNREADFGGDAEAVSSAQQRYEREHFRVQPESVDKYALGRGSLATLERNKVD